MGKGVSEGAENLGSMGNETAIKVGEAEKAL